ncbi:MAG: hypothetical protein H7Y11_01310 [Armatimonadetes bacterium]|nr:hypothetical protein [Anaerolineae bacterium]
MEIPLFDTGDAIPQPKDQIRIEGLNAQPYPDRYRVFIEVKVTPFRERPNLILALRDADRRMVAELSIIETMHANMEFTMHIRHVTDPAGDYMLTADLFYETKNPPQDQREVEFTIPSADDLPQNEDQA